MPIAPGLIGVGPGGQRRGAAAGVNELVWPVECGPALVTGSREKRWVTRAPSMIEARSDVIA